jgi:hypothetical protein
LGGEEVRRKGNKMRDGEKEGKQRKNKIKNKNNLFRKERKRKVEANRIIQTSSNLHFPTSDVFQCSHSVTLAGGGV